MPVHNKEIAEAFAELGDLLEIEGANPFRVRAYRNAAEMIRGLPRSLADLHAEGANLSELPAIGEDLAEKIETILNTGRLPALDQARERTGAGLADLMKIEGLGPKRVRQLHDELNIRSVETLKSALEKNRIRELSGFGKKTEQKIREAIERLPASGQRTHLADAEVIAQRLVKYLQNIKGVNKVIVAGSYRRRKATVGDLDILVTATKDTPVMETFVNYKEVEKIISKGETRSSVRFKSGIHVDLRMVPNSSYGAALHYFTGSKEHNIAVRTLGVKAGLKINEYGVFRGDEKIAGKTEKEVYRQVDLPYIEPELRENRGELEAAKKGQLPRLIKTSDIHGDLHCHANTTDGHDSLADMARAAKKLGYEYLAITDHSKRMSMTGGLDKNRLQKQIDAIDTLNEKTSGIVILKSIELDILEDGSLGFPDEILKKLDLTVCAVRASFGLSRKQQTKRIIRAMDNPNFNILAHPGVSQINQREAYDIDLEAIMHAAKERGCFLEIDAQAERLDLADVHCKAAKDIGLKLSISSGAHNTEGLKLLRFGIDQARRGWLEKYDVINTRGLTQLRKLLRR